MDEKEVGFAPGRCEKEALGLSNECHFLSLNHSYMNCMKWSPVHEKDLYLWGT